MSLGHSLPVMAAGDKAYDRLLKGLRPGGLHLVKCSAVLNPEVFFRDLEKPSKQSISIGHKPVLNRADKKHFEVKAKLSLEIKGSNRKESALKLSATYLVFFHSDEPITKALMGRFIDSEFSVFIWPFFREFVHEMTARMSIPPLLVPFITEIESKPTKPD